MRFVPIKSLEQQDIQMLHRVRSGFVKERTALANRIRGLLAEYGIIVAIGLVKVRQQLPDILEDAENGLTMAARTVFADLQCKTAYKTFQGPGEKPARHYFSRKLKWGSIRFQQRKMTWRVCLRRPAFVPLQPKTQNIGFRLASYFDLARMT